MTRLVKWNGAYYTKNVIIAFKILISKWQWLGPCASWFTKDQEGHKLHWASGNKVLDTFSTIQYMTICCLCHANIIMPSAIWLELSNLRVALFQVTKMSLRTPDPLYTHTWRFGIANVFTLFVTKRALAINRLHCTVHDSVCVFVCESTIIHCQGINQQWCCAQCCPQYAKHHAENMYFS